MFDFWENRSLVSGVSWHLLICKVSLIFPKWWSLQDLRLWLWCCWTYDILCTITARFISSLSNYLLWGCETEVSDCPFEVHFIIYDDHKMWLWFHISHVFTSVQQRVYRQPRNVTGTRCFLVCECTLILCGDLRSLFLKMLMSTFYKKCVMSGKLCMIRTLVVCTAIIVEGQWS